MERITYRITLDTHRTGIQRTLQGFEIGNNMSRRISMNLVASGDTFEIPFDHVTAMMYVLPQGAKEPSINECVIEGNTIIYDVLPTDIATEGITEMQVKIIEGRTDGARKVLVSPKFALEVTESNIDDESVESTTTFTALEEAVVKAKCVYDSRLVSVEITDDYNFRAYYADGTYYETDALYEALHNGNALLAESYAKGGTGIREGEDADNSMYYAGVSRSASAGVNMVAEESKELLDEARLQTAYTAFNVNFETGNLDYASANYTFDVNEETGNLEAESDGSYVPEQIIGGIVDDYLEEKTEELYQKIDEVSVDYNEKIAIVDEKADTATNIAKGRNQAIVFTTTAEMQEWLSNADNKGLRNKGDNIYIEELEVPDWWIAEVLEEADPETGYYYKIAQLETQKVDLTNYLSKDTVLDTMEEIESNQQEHKPVGALALNELSLNVSNSVKKIRDTIEGIASGNSIHVDDSKEAPCIVNAYGNTEQDTTSGKNLFDCSGLSATTTNGITFTPVYDENGLLEYINVNGTNDSAETSVLAIPITLNASTDYILNGCPSGGSASKYRLYIANTTDSTAGIDYGSGATFNTGEVTSWTVRLRIESGVTVSNLKFYPMIRLATITDGTYEPFTNGAIPNPDCPQEFESAVLSEIKICRKNLFDYSKLVYGTINSITGAEESHATTQRTDYIPCKSNTSYTISNMGSEASRNSYFSKDKKLIKSTLHSSANGTITTPNDCSFFVIQSAETNWTTETMIEQGTTATEYESYTESVATLSNPITMNGLNGVSDYVDAKRGVLVQRFKEITLNGSESGWEYKVIYDSMYREYYNVFVISLSDFNYRDSYTVNYMCTAFKGIPERQHNKHNTFIVTESNELEFTHPLHTTVDEWKAWLASNPITVLYELAEPIETPLSADVVRALRELKTFDGITNVSSDSKGNLEMIYATTEQSAVIMENNKELQKCLRIVSFDAETGTLVTESVNYTG